MSRKMISGPINNKIQPTELSREHKKLRLECGNCGHKARYDVGCVMIDPGERSEDNRKESLLKSLCFSGYFRCKKCDSAWPWEFPSRTSMAIMGEITRLAFGMSSSGVKLGATALFDGTICRSAADGEDYLLERIAEQPDEFYLRSRLGNLYRQHGMNQQAQESYEQAIERNERDGESWYNLGCLHREARRNGDAVRCFQQTLRYASHSHHVAPDELRCMVRDTLEQLFEFHDPSEENADFLPGVEPLPGADAPDPDRPVVYLFEFDLETEEGWEKMTDMYFYGSALHERTRKASRLRYDAPESIEEDSQAHSTPKTASAIDRRIPRNRPCPCGSGRKFKNCCGRSVPR